MTSIEANGYVEIRGPFGALSRMYDLLGSAMNRTDLDKELALVLKNDGKAGFVLIICSPDAMAERTGAI